MAGVTSSGGTATQPERGSTSLSFKDLTLDCGPLSKTNLDVWQTHIEAFAKTLGCYDALFDDNASAESKQQARFLLLKNVRDTSDVSIFISDQSAKQIYDKLKSSKAAGTVAQQSMLMMKEAELKPHNGESLSSYIDRAKELYSELERASMLDERRYLLKFLTTFENISQFSAWAQTVNIEQHTFQEVATALLARNLNRADQPLVGSAKAMNESSALNVSGKYCDFCEKAGHSEQECRSRKYAKEQRKQNARGRGRGRGRSSRGAGNGKPAGGHQANSTCFFAVHAVSHKQLDVWIHDSGCTDHMTNNFDALENVTYIEGVCTLANKQKVPVVAKGNVCMRDSAGRMCTLKDVLYVPDLNVNLISLSKAHKAGLDYKRTAEGLQISSSKMTLSSKLQDDLFVVNCSVVNKQHSRAPASAPPQAQSDAQTAPSYDAVVQQNAAQLFHRRLAHKGYSSIAKMSTNGVVTGLPAAQHFTDELKAVSVCAPCAEGKQHRNSFPKAESKATRPLQKLHIDIATGLPPSVSGATNYVVIVDDFTGFIICGIIKAKSDAPEFVMETIRIIQNMYGKKVAQLRSDRDSVFMSKSFKAQLRSNGTRFEPTSGYSPAENGHAERAIRTLGEAYQAMLSDSGLSNNMWAECLRHAVYVTNITSSDGKKTPWELLKNEKPDVSNLHIWGCTAWVNVPKELRLKGMLPPKAKAGKHLGFDQPNMKAYRILMPNGKIVTSRDVLFDESAPPASAVTDETFVDFMLPAPPREHSMPPQQTTTTSPDNAPADADSDDDKSVSNEDTVLQADLQQQSPASACDAAAPPAPPASRIPSPQQQQPRRSTREKKQPNVPYTQWLRHANTATASQSTDVPFTRAGCHLSPHP